MSEEELPPAWSECFLPDALRRLRPSAPLAHILGKHPGLTPFQVKTMLMACAKNLRAEE